MSRTYASCVANFAPVATLPSYAGPSGQTVCTAREWGAVTVFGAQFRLSGKAGLSWPLLAAKLISTSRVYAPGMSTKRRGEHALMRQVGCTIHKFDGTGGLLRFASPSESLRVKVHRWFFGVRLKSTQAQVNHEAWRRGRRWGKQLTIDLMGSSVFPVLGGEKVILPDDYVGNDTIPIQIKTLNSTMRHLQHRCVDVIKVRLDWDDDLFSLWMKQLAKERVCQITIELGRGFEEEGRENDLLNGLEDAGFTLLYALGTTDEPRLLFVSTEKCPDQSCEASLPDGHSSSSSPKAQAR
eukprot:TRINITY_DN3792_c0_g1_i1.p1 TRINITY_DN3792_c0_g1~~TRINITY_DN3792_c0_g1_i1.p1  ORF type:complete len:296 (+),score=8.88 TRINITY_DN3792_c0_g1_i1:1-888(+)